MGISLRVIRSFFKMLFVAVEIVVCGAFLTIMDFVDLLHRHDRLPRYSSLSICFSPIVTSSCAIFPALNRLIEKVGKDIHELLIVPQPVLVHDKQDEVD